MAGVTGRAAGFIATLYYSDTVIATKDETNVVAAVIAANKIIDVSAMGSLDKQRTIIDIPVYGEDVAGKLPGQADPGTFDFTLTLNLEDTLHQTIRDDDGKTQHTFILEYSQGADNITYAAFDGFVANASVSQTVDGAIQLDSSVARSGDVTWIDAS